MCEIVIWLGSLFDGMGEMDVWEGVEGRGGCGSSWGGGGRGYCRGWVLLLPTVNMLEVDYCSRDMRREFRWRCKKKNKRE